MGTRNRQKTVTLASAESLARNNNLGRIGPYRAYTYPEWVRSSGEAERRAQTEQYEAAFEMKREGGLRKREQPALVLAEAA